MYPSTSKNTHTAKTIPATSLKLSITSALRPGYKDDTNKGAATRLRRLGLQSHLALRRQEFRLPELGFGDSIDLRRREHSLERSGNRIHAARVPWMTATHAPNSQRNPAQHAVPQDCFPGVIRTGWIEPAAWPEQRADSQLIDPNEPTH
jgi:hypothetical protein